MNNGMDIQKQEIPTIPDEYKGQYTKSGGYTSTAPRRWTKEEIAFTKELLEKGFSNKEIAKSLERSEVSVAIKVKRLKKKDNTYNQKHVIEKYELNSRFLEVIQPNTVLDLFCGEKNFYAAYNTTTNDINENINAQNHEDAFKLICQLYHDNKKFDLIDLDPFGSAYDCFDLAVKMARKGLVITLGELGHKRWKRLDYVKPRYDIESIEDFTIERLIEYIQKIGLRNKKRLEVWEWREWQNIGRVYFKITETKITTQWEKNNEGKTEEGEEA